MAGILNDKLKAKVDQLEAYVRRKLTDVRDCNREMQLRVVAEITARITSESKLLLGNAISLLSQDFIARHSGDADRMRRYFDLGIEKKLQEGCRFECDFADMVNARGTGGGGKSMAIGAGAVGAAAGAFIARRFATSVFSPQVASAALITAAVCFCGVAAFLAKSGPSKRDEFVEAVLRDFHRKLLEWLDATEAAFNDKIAAI